MDHSVLNVAIVENITRDMYVDIDQVSVNYYTAGRVALFPGPLSAFQCFWCIEKIGEPGDDARMDTTLERLTLMAFSLVE